MKIEKVIFFTLALGGGVLYAQALEPQTYARLRDYMVMTNHQTSEELKPKVDAVTANPVPYLRALAEEPGLRIYAKQKAISLLQFYQTAESETFLIGKISDGTLHPSLRNFAVKSYAEGFYRQNPGKAEAVLAPLEHDQKIGASVRRSLNLMRQGRATEAPRKPQQDKDFRRGAERR